MEVSFELTQRDLFAFNLAHAWRRKLIWAVIVLVPTFVVLVKGFTGEWTGVLNAFGYWSILVVFFCFFYWAIALLSIVIRNRTKGFRDLLVHQRLVVSESGIEAETPRGRSEINWSAVQKMIETRNLFMIYVTPVNALLFPRRVFGSDSEFRDFMEQARTFHRHATSPRPGEQAGEVKG